MKNPKWQFDEIMLALELYLSSNSYPPGPNDLRVKNLSLLLRLNAASKGIKVSKTFRNPNGVAMKLQNIRSLDENFDGKGLRRGSGLENDIWLEYSSKPNYVKNFSNKIRKKIEGRFINE